MGLWTGFGTDLAIDSIGMGLWTGFGMDLAIDSSIDSVLYELCQG